MYFDLAAWLKDGVFNLGASIKGGLLSQIENIHRGTIDNATERKQEREKKVKIGLYDDSATLFIPGPYYTSNACKSCPTHPSNGGSGICWCTLGTPKITC